MFSVGSVSNLVTREMYLFRYLCRTCSNHLVPSYNNRRIVAGWCWVYDSSFKHFLYICLNYHPFAFWCILGIVLPKLVLISAMIKAGISCKQYIFWDAVWPPAFARSDVRKCPCNFQRLDMLNKLSSSKMPPLSFILCHFVDPRLILLLIFWCPTPPSPSYFSGNFLPCQ